MKGVQSQDVGPRARSGIQQNTVQKPAHSNGPRRAIGGRPRAAGERRAIPGAYHVCDRSREQDVHTDSRRACDVTDAGAIRRSGAGCSAESQVARQQDVQVAVWGPRSVIMLSAAIPHGCHTKMYILTKLTEEKVILLKRDNIEGNPHTPLLYIFSLGRRCISPSFTVSLSVCSEPPVIAEEVR